MTADEVRTHLRYSGWASRRLLGAAVTLGPEDLNRDMGVSHRSVLGTLAHIHFADRTWFSRVADPSIESDSAGDPPALQTLEGDWSRIQKRWEEWAGSLTDADLTHVVSYKTSQGTPHQTPVWQIVLHVVNHATLHRGQVMAMLRRLGVPPPPTDLIFYYRELQAAG